MDPISLGLAGAGLAGGLTDLFGSRSANKQNAANLKKILNILRGLQAESGVVGAKALQERRKALEDVQGGFDSALASTAGAGMSAETAARDEAVRARGLAQQDLLNSGNYDPQGLAWAQRGISSDLGRVLGAIRESVGQQQAGIQMQRGAAIGGARGDIASQIVQNFATTSNIAGNVASAIGSQPSQYTPQGANIGQLIYGLTSAFGGGSKPKGSSYAMPYADRQG
jgi:hypothetical protein